MADVGTRSLPRLFDTTAKRRVDLRIELRRLRTTLPRIANRMGQAFWPTLNSNGYITDDWVVGQFDFCWIVLAPRDKLQRDSKDFGGRFRTISRPG